MKIKRIAIIYLMVLCTVGSIYGDGQNRAGTAAAPELLIPFGSRYVGMGGAAVAMASGLESIYWNPAGIDAVTNSANLMFSYRTYIADMSTNFFAASAKFDFGSIAISLRNMDIGDIPVTTMDQPDGTGEKFSPAYFVLGFSYSKFLSDRISVGATINLVSETVAKTSANALAFDIGVQYRELLSVHGLNLGLTIKNLGGSMKYSGSGLWFQGIDPSSERGTTYYTVGAAEFELPSSVALGVAYKKQLNATNSLMVATSYQNNNFSYDDIRFGFEYEYDNLIFLRAGYQYSPGTSEEVPNIFQSFTLGFGVDLSQYLGTGLSFDYAYVPVEYFDANHLLTVKIGF